MKDVKISKVLKDSNKKDKDNTDIILPLLTYKEAKQLALSGTKEIEMQKVADLIRSTANQFKYVLEVVDLNHSEYIYNTLIKNGYSVIYKSYNSLSIRWE